MTPKRVDGRVQDETRTIEISFGDLSRVDGSAKFGFGETKALSSLSGPVEVRLASELPSKATVEVSVRPLSNVPATESKFLATTVKYCLESSVMLTKNPRSLIQLVVQSMSTFFRTTWSPSLAAAMINSSTIAILNAGSIPLRGVIAAVAVGRTKEGTFIIDPSDQELDYLASYGFFAFLFADEFGLEGSNADCVTSDWRSNVGGYDDKELYEAKTLALGGAETVYKAMRQSLSFEIIGRLEALRRAEGAGDDKMLI